jgi:predicted metal-dependent hydrolase
MRKRFVVAIALGVLGLGLVFAASQAGIGQMDAQLQTPPQTPMAMQPPMPGAQAGQPQGPSKERIQPERLQEEIALLKLINEMGLSSEQLKTLQQMISELLANRQAVVQAQMDLRDFLLEYQGLPDGLAEALKPYEEKVEGARQAFREALQSSVNQLKDLLTLRQGEVLREFLRKHFSARMKGLKPEPGKAPWWHFPGELEIRIETGPPAAREREHLRLRSQELEEQLKALQEKLERWLSRWGLEFDFDEGSLPPFLKHERQDKMQDKMKEKPRIFLRIRPYPRAYGWGFGPLERRFLEQFLIEKLELLEALLRERLQRLEGASAAQI